jgi:hypothetical protein
MYEKTRWRRVVSWLVSVVIGAMMLEGESTAQHPPNIHRWLR